MNSIKIRIIPELIFIIKNLNIFFISTLLFYSVAHFYPFIIFDKKNIMRSHIYLIIAALILFSCENEVENNTDINGDTSENTQPFKISYVENTTLYSIGDQVSVKLTSQSNDFTIDSLMVKIDNITVPFSREGDVLKVESGTVTTTGAHTLIVIATSKNKSYQSSLQMLLRSDVVPVKKTFKILKTYPHDRGAYTQGLEFFNNDLYESTGQYGNSSLRKVNLTTGVVDKIIAIDEKYFAEGLTIVNGKIIQLTWQENVGFIYDLNLFKQVSTFHNPTEGWGLTHNEKELILSDGSSTIYFLDSSSYAEIRRIQVYDNESEVKLLNELEYVEGFLYANIYTKDVIAKIDPNTGKVLEYINMEGLLSQQDRQRDTDVLNGIAYKKDTKQLYVTGKNWPKLFEVVFIDKN